MRVCGIVAEYDPFHLGHAYHLNAAREKSQADFVVCVTGCAFSQRGTPMLLGTHARARMAVLAGADVVLGMPVSFSCAAADRFAMGGVGILHALGVVTHLSFGSENPDIAQLVRLANLLEKPDEGMRRALRNGLAQGKSFARARGESLDAQAPGTQALQHQPNATLAISYLRTLQRLGSDIQPVPIARKGAYHAQALQGLASASAVRAAILRGDWQGVARSVPASSYDIIAQAAAQGTLHLHHALDTLLLACILAQDPHQAADIPEMSEGLHLRIARAARGCTSREQLLNSVKTRRYPRTRINRGLTHWMLGTRASMLPEKSSYAYLLAARERAKPVLTAISKHGFRLISRPAREKDPDVMADMRAEELWYLGAQLPVAQAYRHHFTLLQDTGELP